MAIDQAAPEFVCVMRGYDRAQVDDYVSTLLGWLQETTDRAQQAERGEGAIATECEQLRRRVAELERRAAAVPRTSDQLGERVNAVMSEAERLADAIGASAQLEAERAAEEAAAIIHTAHRNAEEIGRAAESAAAETRRRAVEDVKRLRAARDSVAGDLVRLRAAIEAALDSEDAAIVDLRDARPSEAALA